MAGYIVPKAEMAFSTPTEDGIGLAIHYTGMQEPLRIYTPL